MNDAVDEPSKPTSAEPPFREISDEDLQRILADHKKWLAAEDKAGLDHLRANLSGADLRGQDAILRASLLQEAILEGAQLQAADLAEAQLQRANLSRAQLQGANLAQAQLEGAILNLADLRRAQLQRAILTQAQLQWAQLTEAQLQGAELIMAQLQKAFLNAAELQGAFLPDAQLQNAYLPGAQLQGAVLSQAQLQGATLINAQLQDAHLPGAQLQGASLNGAVLREASLTSANFEQLVINKGGEPGQERSADVTDADFRDADLSNAQLSTVIGLRAEKLAGAVLTNAKLPEHVAKFDRLTHAAETSKHAGTTFFALLAASLYSGLTIGTTTDVALITGAASSPLPIINTNIALSGFYWVAPLILLGVYFYLHLYLQRLWSDLASLPAVFPDGEALDSKAYPWLLNGLVRAHFARLKLGDRPLSRLENLVSIALAWWVVPVMLVLFWLRYLPRHDWWGTGLHVALIAIAVGFGVRSYRLAVRTLSGAEQPSAPGQDEPFWAWIWRGARSYRPDSLTIFALSSVVVLSVWAAVAPGDNFLTMLGYETYAGLTDDEVSLKPSGWTGRTETAEVEIAQVKGADLVGIDLRTADASNVFLVKAKLASADLRGAGLRHADLREASLGAADLSCTIASYANLRGADLRDANLSNAVLNFANLIRANLANTNLSGAILGGSNLSGADLWGANLRDAELSGVNLRDADFTGADITGATFGESHPRRTVCVPLWIGPPNRVVDLTGTKLSGARGLTKAQLNRACGDDTTQLPQGLRIRTCPVAAPPASASPPPGSS
jgi:uncharacterized protein YjbI with pentapeptide repeats